MPIDYFSPQLREESAGLHFRECQTPRGASGQRDEKNQIWRFKVGAAPPYAILPDSGEMIIDWSSAGHDGGDMGFGPDGDLYITAGDGTTGSDPDITGQDLTDLRASILRIDVDHPDPGKALRHSQGQSVPAHPQGAAGNLGVRIARPVADELRSADRQSLGRRRRPGFVGDDPPRQDAGGTTAGA